MTRYKMIKGEHVAFTKKEEAQRDKEEAAAKKEVIVQRWRKEMALSDQTMTRVEEDIIDVLEGDARKLLPSAALDRHAAKKKLRATMPDDI